MSNTKNTKEVKQEDTIESLESELNAIDHELASLKTKNRDHILSAAVSVISEPSRIVGHSAPNYRHDIHAKFSKLLRDMIHVEGEELDTYRDDLVSMVNAAHAEVAEVKASQLEYNKVASKRTVVMEKLKGFYYKRDLINWGIQQNQQFDQGIEALKRMKKTASKEALPVIEQQLKDIQSKMLKLDIPTLQQAYAEVQDVKRKEQLEQHLNGRGV